MTYSKKTLRVGLIDLALLTAICVVLVTTRTYAESAVIISDTPVIEANDAELPEIKVTLIPMPCPVEQTENTDYLSDEVPLPEDLQKYVWKQCQNSGIKYTLFLALLQQESQFGTYGCGNRGRYAVIGNGVDYGMTQINCGGTWKEVKEGLGWDDDTPITTLFDPYKSVDAGIYRFAQCVSRYGNTEAAYDAYNRGMEHHGSTKNSRQVMKYWNHWSEVLGDI